MTKKHIDLKRPTRKLKTSQERTNCFLHAMLKWFKMWSIMTTFLVSPSTMLLRNLRSQYTTTIFVKPS